MVQCLLLKRGSEPPRPLSILFLLKGLPLLHQAAERKGFLGWDANPQIHLHQQRQPKSHRASLSKPSVHIRHSTHMPCSNSSSRNAWLHVGLTAVLWWFCRIGEFLNRETEIGMVRTYQRKSFDDVYCKFLCRVAYSSCLLAPDSLTKALSVFFCWLLVAHVRY